MENQGNSFNDGKQNRLEIYIDKKVDSKAIDLLSNISSTNPNSQITLKQKKNNYLLKYNNSYEISLPEDCLELSKGILGSSETLEVKCPQTEILVESKKFFKKCETIDSLCKNIGNIPFFKGFNTCQILVHEKGKSHGESYISDVSGEVNTRFFTAESFNPLYTKIKKSKNKIFNQSDIKSELVDIIGTFLAKEIQFNSFSIIIILSRGDFFNPDSQLRQIFDQFLTLSQNHLLSLLQKNKLLHYREELHKLINTFPFYIKIWNDELDISNSKDKEETTTISANNLYIEFSRLDPKEHNTDILHNERLKLMGELLNTLKHELSNPLFGINISADLLSSEDILADDVKETIKEIGNGSKRCQSIIENFSDLYGNSDSFQEVNLKKLVEETVTLTKSESKFFERIISIPEDLVIYTNPTLLSQIIFNLVINSSHALATIDSQSKQIRIEANQAADKVEVLVIDNGPGIPKDNATKVFDPFFTTKDKGTGLGLSICKNIALKINSSLELLDSDQGVRFKITIPRGQNA